LERAAASVEARRTVARTAGRRRSCERGDRSFATVPSAAERAGHWSAKAAFDHSRLNGARVLRGTFRPRLRSWVLNVRRDIRAAGAPRLRSSGILDASKNERSVNRFFTAAPLPPKRTGLLTVVVRNRTCRLPAYRGSRSRAPRQCFTAQPSRQLRERSARLRPGRCRSALRCPVESSSAAS